MVAGRTAGRPRKRTEERLGHSMGEADTRNKTVQVEHDFITIIPGEADSWHPYAKWWYRSLRVSGQSKWYENSDWMMAFIAADVLSTMLENGEYRAGQLAEWNGMAARLMVCEADRRHANIELIKVAANPDEEAGQVEASGWKSLLAGEVVVD